jgi:hypothetical protein
MTAQRFTVNLIFRFKCEAYGIRIHPQNNFSTVVSLCQPLPFGRHLSTRIPDRSVAWFERGSKIKHPPEVLSRVPKVEPKILGISRISAGRRSEDSRPRWRRKSLSAHLCQRRETLCRRCSRPRYRRPLACKFSYLVTDINLAFIDRMLGTELFCRRKLILALVLTMTSLHIDNTQLQAAVANTPAPGSEPTRPV